MEVKKQVIEVGNLKARIRELEAQLDAAKAENAKLENRHVQFMVEGGPVVMATDYDELKAENDRLRAALKNGEEMYLAMRGRCARTEAALDKATGPVTDGVSLIAAERKRQIEVEYWSPAHDDEWEECQLLDAALCYAGMAGSLIMDSDKGEEARIGLVEGWPWDAEWWKPSQEPIRNLVKAGALIAAEIDRLQRLAAMDHSIAEANGDNPRHLGSYRDVFDAGGDQ